MTINDKLAGGMGLTIAIISGSLIAIGMLLVYHNFVDWINLRLIRSQIDSNNSELIDGEVFAFSGIVKIDGDPLKSPITATPCAAYTYVVAVSRSGKSTGHHRSRSVLAQGFHMLRTRIEGATRVLTLGALPGFETDLRETDQGSKWAKEVRQLLKKLEPIYDRMSERAILGELLEARNNINQEAHQDYCRVKDLPSGDQFIVEEEILLVDQDVCVIGTYNQSMNGLTPTTNRFGDNLMVYKGNAKEVLERVGKDLKWYAKIAVWMVGSGITVLVFSMLPVELTSSLPLIGGLVTG